MLWDKDIIPEEDLPENCNNDLCHPDFEYPTGLYGLLGCNKKLSDKDINQGCIADKRFYMAGSRSHHSDFSKNPNLGELHKVQKSWNNAQEMYLVLGNMEEDNSRAKYDIMGEEIHMLFKTAFDATHVNTNFSE